MKIIVADQDRIDGYAETAREFFRTVLDMNFDECLVTDESRLTDFSSCGLPDEILDISPMKSFAQLYEAWDAWILPVIREKYKIDIEKTNIYLVDLFEAIEQRSKMLLQ